VSKNKKPRKPKKVKRPLKDYEIDHDVIDLDTYVAFHTRNYSVDTEDTFEYAQELLDVLFKEPTATNDDLEPESYSLDVLFVSDDMVFDDFDEDHHD
jgi:hypothetical protein